MAQSRGLRFAQLFTWLFFLGIFAFFLRPLSGDADFYHHISTGRFVLTSHQLPDRDTWTFTANRLPWVAHSWLAGVILYIMFTATGFVGVGILLTLVATLTFWLLFLWLRSLKVPLNIRFITLAFAAPVVALRWPNRPEVFCYPILLGLFLVDEHARRSPKIAVLFPLLIFLWANMYGANVIAGLFIVGILMVRRYFSDSRRILPSSVLFYLAGMISFPLSLVNGYGLRTIFYVLNLRQIAQYQGEWAGILDTLTKAPLEYVLTFQYLAATLIVYLVIYLFIVSMALPKSKISPFYVFLSASLAVPLFAFRQTPLAVLLSVPLFALGLWSIQGKLQRVLSIIIFFVTVALVGLSVWLRPLALPVASDLSSTALIAFIKSNKLSGRTFANQRLGSYLSYYLDPDIKVFVDTRDDLFLPTRVFPDILDSGSVLTLAQTYGVDQFVLDFADDGPRFQPLLYSPDWAPVFINYRHLVVVKRTTATTKRLPILDAIDPFGVSGAKMGLEQEALRQYQTGQNVSYLISLFMALQQYDQAKHLMQTSPLPFGSSRPLVQIVNQELLGDIAIARRDCTSLTMTVSALEKLRKYKFLFSPQKILPTKINKYQAFATLLCGGNYSEAKKELERYISEIKTNLILVNHVKKQFDELAKALPAKLIQ